MPLSVLERNQVYFEDNLRRACKAVDVEAIEEALAECMHPEESVLAKDSLGFFPLLVFTQKR